MAEQYRMQKSNSPNANLVALILILSALITGGVIVANVPLTPSPADGGNGVEVAQAEATATLLPTSTPLPPTLTPTPLPTQTVAPTVAPTQAPPTMTSTAPAVADAGQASPQNTTASYDPALVSQGQTLYMVCSACHGPDGRGLPNLGKDLVASDFVHSLTDEELLNFVKTGRPMWDPLNTTGIDMPPKGGNPAFSDDDILAIIAYLRSLSAASG